MVPAWLHALSIIGVAAGIACALLIAADEFRHPQRMAIMNAVWPLVALFAGVLAVAAYLRWGRDGGRHARAVSVGIGAAHCGSGCALGDLCAEWLAVAVPGVAGMFGWPWLFPERMFAVWVLDFVFAFGFGIVFQYFSIAPMRGLGLRDGLRAALRADALSLTAWQLGMYGFMAAAAFTLFRAVLGTELRPASVEFWFMIQLAMLCGFATSYPVNWWLIRAGYKEAM